MTPKIFVKDTINYKKVFKKKRVKIVACVDSLQTSKIKIILILKLLEFLFHSKAKDFIFAQVDAFKGGNIEMKEIFARVLSELIGCDHQTFH
jgi:hypothetical protein